MKQKIYVLAVVLITSLLACSQLFAASSGKCGENLTWTLDDDGNLVIEGTGNMTNGRGSWGTEIKTSKIAEGVTSIGENAFCSCEKLLSIDIPNSVTYIGACAFEDCYSLISINLPNSLTSINENTFYRCRSIKNIIIPNTVESIGKCAFYYCESLKSIDIPNSVTYIGDFAFCQCNRIKSVEIPNSLTKINYGTFKHCTSLNNVVIPNTLTCIGNEAFYGCIALSLLELPSSVSEIVSSALSNSNRVIRVNAETPPILSGPLDMAVVIVPDASISAYKSAQYWKDLTITSAEKSEVEVTLTGGVSLAEAIVKQAKIAPASVTAIKVHGSLTSDDIKTTLGINMRNCYSVDISDTDVEELPDEALKDKTILVNMVLPKNLKKIGNSVFKGCNFLKHCNLEAVPVIEIGDMAFNGCRGLNVKELPNNLERIGNASFVLSGIDIVTLPKTVKTIGDRAFGLCRLLSQIKFPKGVKEIGSLIFADCKYLNFIDMINTSICTIPQDVFNNCTSLEEVKLPTAIESIGNNAFSGCSKLYNIALPSSVKTVGANAFSGCKSLKVLNLSKSLATIGNGAFGGCSAVEIINCPAQVPPTISSESTLKDINKNTCVLSIPSDKYIEYFSAPYWGQFLEYKSGVCVLVNEDNGCVKYTVNNIEAESSTNAIRTNALTQASVDECNINAEAFNNANICVNENMTITFKIIPNDGYMIGSVKYAGSDVTSQVINGVYTTPLVTGDAEFVVTFKDEFSSVDENEVTDNFKVWSDGMTICVESGERIAVNVTSLIGVTRTYVAESGVTEIKVATPGIYIVNGKKVLVR